MVDILAGERPLGRRILSDLELLTIQLLSQFVFIRIGSFFLWILQNFFYCLLKLFQALVLFEGVTVGHSGDEVTDLTGVASGLVHIAAARKGDDVLHERCLFDGDRTAVREASVLKAMDMISRLAG